jgi:isocitrate lyase
MTIEHEIKRIQADRSTNARWKGVKCSYEPEGVIRLRGTVKVERRAQPGAPGGRKTMALYVLRAIR